MWDAYGAPLGGPSGRWSSAKNKHGINTVIVLFAQCSRYLYYFSSQMNKMY